MDADTLLDIRLSAVCSQSRYTSDPGPVIEELRAMAGVRTDVLAMVAGTWAGYYDSPETHALAFALRGLPGAEAWVPLGQRRRGILNHGENPPANYKKPPTTSR
jgi:hypothetical protein